MAFPPATNMITNVLGHTDISESVLNYLGYDAVRSLSKVSKTVRALCDFSTLLERKTARFVDGKTDPNRVEPSHIQVHSRAEECAQQDGVFWDQGWGGQLEEPQEGAAAARG